MDEFSWFVGLYEGEGCIGSRRCKKRYKNRTYYSGGVTLTIRMTDEDTVARAAKFLGVKYKAVSGNNLSKKQLYQVRVSGGKDGKLMDLMLKMKPHLCKRRQEQFDYHIGRAMEWGNTVVYDD